MKSVIGRELGIITEGGFVVAPNENCISQKDLDCVMSFAEDNHEIFTYNGYTYKPVSPMRKCEYIAFVQGDDPLARNYVDILDINFSSLKSIYDDKHDTVNFIKNILMDNILPGDVLAKAAELHFAVDEKRVVMLVQANNVKDFSIFEIIENMFPEKGQDFIVGIDEENIAIVKSIDDDLDVEDFSKLAKEISNTIETEAMAKVNIGIGTAVSNVRDISRSYKEARSALEIGGIFDNEKSIISYEDLGIGRLIYQLPTTLCELFLAEVFKKGTIEDLDQEILLTIQKFFENNLNVSETSRQLYVHRNTLVYRLDKIQKITGLDLRIFDQAIIFKVAMMVNKYLSADDLRI